MMSSVAFADDVAIETCADGAGKVVVGVSGHKYCKSNNTMNWWNAVSWCDALGRRLFDLSGCSCGNTTADCRGKCPELVNIGGDKAIWCMSSRTSTNAHYVQLPAGTLGGDNNLKRSNSNLVYAFCY